MDDPRVIYLDTETTGFGPRAEIVDIAAVSAAGEVLLESLVQPTRRIPADATRVHGITNADVKDAPAWCDQYALSSQPFWQRERRPGAGTVKTPE